MPNDRSSRPPPSLGAVRPERDGHYSQASGPLPPPQRPEPPPSSHPHQHADPRLGPAMPAPRRAPPPSPLPPEPERTGWGCGRIAVSGVLGLLALIGIGVGVLALALPADLVRDRVAAEVERQTGRKLTIGSTRVSFTSGAAVTLSRVSLSAPPAMGGSPLLTADRLEINLALLPLVLREVKVERLSLLRPVLDLRVDAQGRRSWDFAGAAVPGLEANVRYAQASGRANDAQRLPPELKEFVKNASPPGNPGSGSPLGLEGLSLADVHIADGTIRYADAQIPSHVAGNAREVSGIDARIALPTVGGPLDVNGHVVVQGERIAVDGRLETLREVLAERPANVRLKLVGKTLAASYDGKLVGGALMGVDGRLDLKTPSAEGLARLLQLPLFGLEGVGQLALDGAVKASGTSIALSSASFAVGETSGTGSFSLDAGRNRPRIAANLRLASVDLDRLAALAQSGAQHQSGAEPPAVGRFAAPPAATTAPKSIDDLIGQPEVSPPPANPAAKVRGFRKRAGNQWDVEAIDLTVLKGFDFDGRFQVAELKSGALKANALSAGLELKDSVLRVSITDGEIGGGKVRGLTNIDFTQPALAVGANISGDSVAVQTLLAAAGIDLMAGRGRTIVTVSARGSSERELVSTLAGRAEFKVTDGALVGWDADRIIAGLGRGQIPQTKRQLDQRTPFRELSGTFQIANGVARSSDIRLDSPTINATGTGTINIVDRNVDLMLKPKLGSGAGLVVPVRVAGPWDDPSLIADVAGALNSPQAQDAIRQLKDGNVDGALKSVLGGGAKADEKIDKAKDLLRQFLKR